MDGPMNPAPADGAAATLRAALEQSALAHQRLVANPATLEQIARLVVRTLQSGHKVILFGNGGSAADAQHVAAELVGRFQTDRRPLPAIALTTNTSILTAVGNDWSFDQVFARQVQALAGPGDLVVGISTSGRSTNVLCGLEAGRNRGALTVGFTGADGARLAGIADVCFCAPADSAARIQELHITAWHAICNVIDRAFS